MARHTTTRTRSEQLFRATAAVGLLGLLVAQAPASAWIVGGVPGTAAAKAASIPQVAGATASQVGSDVVVAWQSVVLTGAEVDGYTVRAYPAGGGDARALVGTCAGPVTAATCTDSAAPAGTWQYRVTAHLSSWIGPESEPAEVTVTAGSTSIATENAKPGNPSSEWDVAGAGDETIQGFATDISVNRGDTVQFKIDDADAIEYSIPIYRLGYYGGDGARLVDTIPAGDVAATAQPACSETDIPIGGGAATSGKLLDCGNWSVSATWAVPADATSGVYIARPTRSDGGASHIPFIVRDDASTSELVFQTSDTTWQSYNPYGGYNAYGSSGATMAEKLSYNRPFTTRGAELENYLFNAEYPMIRWLERNGYDVSYISAVDTERHAALLTNHEVFLSVGHDEYWSQGRRDAVTAARDARVNLAFFSANEIYWKTRWENSAFGDQAYRTQVVYKEGNSAPSGAAEHRNCYDNFDCDPSDIWTGQWRQAPGSTPENSLSGQISWRLNEVPITVPSEFAPLRFWRGTEVGALDPGGAGQVTLAPGTLGYEWDPEYPEYANFYPAGRLPLSTTTAESSFGGPSTHHLNLYRAESGALVFGAGTVQWSWGLDSNHDRGSAAEDTTMQQATVNLLADLGAQPSTLQDALQPASASTDTTPPTVAVTSPAADASVPGGAITITGTASDVGGVVGAVEISTDDGTTWRRAAGRENWTYTYSAAEGPALIRVRAVDDSVNLSAPVTHTFTVLPRECPCSIWPDTATPATTNANDNQAGGIEVGVKFRASQNGYITGLRYYWAPGDAGTHTGNLWTSAGALLATATFPTATTAGWQQVALSSPVPITAGTTYVASQHSSAGYYPYTQGYFATAFENPPLLALADDTGGPNGPNGVYKYGATGFPTSAFQASNYWVDVAYDLTAIDTTAPIVTATTPANGAVNVAVGTNVSARFSEPIDPATLTGNVYLRDSTGADVTAALSYDAGSLTATLDPSANLDPSSVYTATVVGGAAGVADLASPANRLAADVSWSFTTGAPSTPRPDPNVGPGGPVLVVTGSGEFGSYLPEIMRGEGLNLFTVLGTGALTDAGLADFNTVVLGETTLTTEQVTALADWVTGGGNLIALRPDPQLAGLLGLTNAGGTLAEGYIKVDTSASPGAGIVGDTMQFHGAADLYTADTGTQLVATLYSDATTATTNPAVTLRSVGTQGGSAAAFTFDLARSVVLTRQGNPAWQNINGDGSAGPFRADDMFHNGTDPDYVDLDKVAIPQADEQQRLLANIITETTRDALPLPRFWYLPRGEVAALVMTADEHNGGNVPARFNSEIAASTVDCDVDDWECIRSTSYLYPDYPSMTASQASSYEDQGFEIALHPNTGCASPTRTEFASLLASQLAALETKYPDVEPSSTSRNHCIAWTDYTTIPEELAKQDVHLDTNYYFWPPDWVADVPGLFTGAGFPQRFATTSGQLVDVYQATTQMTDESGQTFPGTAITLMDRAINQGYYGTFVLNFHTDGAGNTHHDPVVEAAQARGVPVISAKQLLTWTDGRNASSFKNLAWDSNQLTFSITAGAGANGLEAMLPVEGPSGTLQALALDGNAVSYATKTVKGVDYAVFTAAAGTYVATYEVDTTPPTVVSVSPLDGATDVEVGSDVTVTFSEAMLASSITAATITLSAGESEPVAATLGTNGAIVTLDPDADLEPLTTYDAAVTTGVTDLAGNALATPVMWSFTTGASEYTIFGDTPGTANGANDTGDYELGVKFRASVSGWVTGVRFYKPAGTPDGTRIGHLWSIGGTKLAEATFTNETASGWQKVSFSSPVAVAAGTTYVASYAWPAGGLYPFQGDAFTTSGVTNGPLTALQSGVDGGNGVLNGTPGTFPNETYSDANYFADVVFVTSLSDAIAPTVTGRIPTPDSTGVSVGSDVTVTFSEPMDAATVTTSTITLRAVGAETDVPATVTLDGAAATLNPTADLAPNTQYTVTVVASVKDIAGNALGADDTWTFTTASAPTYDCPCSIWPDTATPANPAVTDNQPIELGVKFQSSIDGWITGIRFYKGTLNTGTHVGHLWTTEGAQLAEATFTDETASGWQQVDFAAPVAITAGTTYVASYHSSSGYFAIDLGYFTSTGVDSPPLLALQAGVDGPNGVYKYGDSGYPGGGNTANYWVDVVFEEPETIAPTVQSVSPTDGAIDVEVATDVTVTFSEAMLASSITDATITLRAEGEGTDVPATVSLDGDTATLDPAANLEPDTLYTATVTTGVTDRFGNHLAADETWTFTTAAAVAGFMDTSVADFAAGTTDTGTYVGDTEGGEVMLAPTVGAEFAGSSLPTDWGSKETPWTAGGAHAVADGRLSVDGTMVGTTSTYGPGRSLEFAATFSAQSFQHVGFVGDLAFNDPWAIVSTGSSGDGVYARASNGTQVALGSVGGSHRYRIDWTASGFDFFVDGTLQTTIGLASTGPMLVGASDANLGTPLLVEWMRLSPYAGSGTYLSRVFDAGSVSTWDSVTWEAETPTGTTLEVLVRHGDTATPDGTWTDWSTVTTSGDPVMGTDLLTALPGWFVQAETLLNQAQAWAVEHGLPADFGDLSSALLTRSTQFASQLSQKLLALLGATLTLTINSVIVLVLAVFLLLGGESISRGLARWLPASWREMVLGTVNRTFRGYFGGQVMLALILSAPRSWCSPCWAFPMGCSLRSRSGSPPWCPTPAPSRSCW